jgi:hypothetical protein
MLGEGLTLEDGTSMHSDVPYIRGGLGVRGSFVGRGGRGKPERAGDGGDEQKIMPTIQIGVHGKGH